MDLVSRLQRDLPPLPRWMGITITVAEPDRVVAEITVREELCTSGDIMHGGAIMAFADTVGALGTVVNLREGQGTTTMESKTNFFAGSSVGHATDSRGDPTASRKADPGLGDADHQRAGQAGGEGNPDADGAVGSQERERGIRRGGSPRGAWAIFPFGLPKASVHQ